MRAPIAVVLLGLLLAGCGGDDDSDTSSDALRNPPPTGGVPEPATTNPAPAVGGVVPDTAVIDLATGSTVSVRSTVAPDKATLFWFWQPY